MTDAEPLEKMQDAVHEAGGSVTTQHEVLEDLLIIALREMGFSESTRYYESREEYWA